MPKPLFILFIFATLLSGCAAPGVGGPSPGAIAPDFSLRSLDGQAISLSQFAGHPVVIDFWATWCPTCRERLPQIQALAENPDFARRGLVVLAIDERENPSDVRSFMESNKFSFTVLPDTDGRVAQTYGVSDLPTTIIIGRDGKIIAVNIADTGGSADQITQAVAQAIR